MTHVEAADLLGAYALDALDGAEREAVEAHVAGCRWCQQEVVDHREVASMLTSGLARPPEGLWERIAESLEETPPPLDLSPVIALKPATAGGAGAGRAGGAGWRAAALVAVAAAAVIGMLGFKIADDGRRIDRISAGLHGEELQRVVNAALVDPASTKVDMRSDDGVLFADAVVLPDGRGYLVKHNLPTLTADRTYQLWALVGTNRVSVGVLGPGPRQSGFRATGPVWGLALTEEAAGGVVSTEKQPLVVGKVIA